MNLKLREGGHRWELERLRVMVDVFETKESLGRKTQERKVWTVSEYLDAE